MPESTGRFVVLHHLLAGGEHWDLMLEQGPVLATWQLLDDPRGLLAGSPVSGLRARPIGDHRPAYLDYEGPVSGGRGHVTRTDAGQYRLLERRAGLWGLELLGHLLRGTFQLVQPAADGPWWLQRRPAG